MGLNELLEQARCGLDRIDAQTLCCRLAAQEPTASFHDVVVLDTRTPTDRATYGCIPGSVHTPRTVLEWRVAMDAPLRCPQVTSLTQQLVVVCNEGYSSSLAAQSLQALGFSRATDLIGGVMAWGRAGFPLVPPVDDEIGLRADTSGAEPPPLVARARQRENHDG
jgi:rhodanese-related sulfurtransferase